MRNVILGVGVLMVLLGGLWALQGIGVIGGSVMTGQSFWATTGSIVAATGAALVIGGLRGRTRPPSR